MLYHLEQIKKAVADRSGVIVAVTQSFEAYSKGCAQIPAVGHLAFPERNGDTHIKYGHIAGDRYFVVKVASGFQDNPQIGLPSGSGIVLVFSAETGFVKAVLADDGYLTDIRTAAAGAVVANALSPKQVEAIGIIGTGNQARLQLEYLKEVTDCREVWLYGRDTNRTIICKADMEAMGFHVTISRSPAEVAGQANLIVTTTCSKEPLLYGADIRPGTHITAMGTDAPGKNEIHTSVFAKAEVIVADSISQCVDHGDISYAVKDGTIREDQIRELGSVLLDPMQGRINDSQITIADLTGVAVQDIAVAELVMSKLGDANI